MRAAASSTPPRTTPTASRAASAPRPPRRGLETPKGATTDLRFHQGNYPGQAFPVLEPMPVRVDIYNDTWTFEVGDRVGALVSFGVDIDARTCQPWTPLLTLHGGTGPKASHVVLPLVESTLGGDAPTMD